MPRPLHSPWRRRAKRVTNNAPTDFTADLAVEGLADPLAEPLTLATLWYDLCHRTGESMRGDRHRDSEGCIALCADWVEADREHTRRVATLPV